MITLVLAAACAVGVPSSDSTAATIEDAIRFDPTGLPDCVHSITDASFCDGWNERTQRNRVAGGNYVPDWLWNARDPAAMWMSTTFQEPGQFLCADDAAAATAMLQEVSPQDPDHVSGVDESDPRWLDVHFSVTETAFSVFRVPRCAMFTTVANVGALWPGWEAPRIIDPIWQLAALPADRLQFFDMARMIDVYRYVESDAFYDTSQLWAIGSAADDTTWTLRTCRLDGVSNYVAEDNYRTAVWQTDYTMDVASGRATLTATDVRGVTCDHWLGADPPG